MSEVKQDMPPPGGYRPINYKRVPARTFFGGWSLIGAYLGVTAGAAYLYYLNCKAVKTRELEMHCANLAIFPMLLAERDREYLRQLRRNREEESKLMANVEGWKTGTWYGEPVYHTVPKDQLFEPTFAEYNAHASYKDANVRSNLKLWC